MEVRARQRLAAPQRPHHYASTIDRRAGDAADSAAAIPLEPLLDTVSPPLRLKANWSYEVLGARRHYTIQAWLGKRLVGRAHGWFEAGGRFLLEKVEIDGRHRSKGYGTALIESLRAQARESGCTEFVFGGVRDANTRAIRLYESMGGRGIPKSNGLLDFVIAPP